MQNKTLWIVLGALAVVVIYIFSSYNSLVTANESIDGQWAQVETQYQRRFDLIPGLVESVKSIQEQEREVFGNLADARARYSGATSVNDKVAAATQVEGALARLLAIVENYPQLNSAQNVRDFMTQLEGTENRISTERMRFNEAVQGYNVRVKRVPTVIVAKLFGFDARPYFESVETAEVAPVIDFNLGE